MPEIEIKKTEFSKNNEFKKQIKKVITFYIIPALLIISVITAIYFYKKYTALKSDQNKQSVQKDEVSEIVAKVGRLMALPEGETPTVATVKQPEKLKDQAFFAHAKEGDKVLIYSNAKKAILYSPQDDKIVEVAGFSNETGEKTGITQPGATQPQLPPQ